MSAYAHRDDPALYFTRNRTCWSLKFIQQIKTGKVAPLLKVYFWNASGNGFRVNDSVPNNNTVLASESNLIWILGTIQAVLYLSVLKFKKQTNQQQKRGRQLYKAQLHGGLTSYLCLPSSPDSSFSASLDHLSLFLLGLYHCLLLKQAHVTTYADIPCGRWKFQKPYYPGAHSSPSVSSYQFWHKVQSP